LGLGFSTSDDVLFYYLYRCGRFRDVDGDDNREVEAEESCRAPQQPKRKPAKGAAFIVALFLLARRRSG
jgi:hypothetical protein